MEEYRDYCKIMIVDDEYVMRQGMKHMIEWEKEGYKIIGEAANGEEALKMADELKPDIVFADIVMPVINGIEFTLEIKKKHPKIRVIILSSYDKFEYVKEALLNGAVDYILKPSLRPELLKEVLEKTIKTIPNMRLKKDAELSMSEKLSRYLSGYHANITENDLSKYFPHTRFRLLCANLSLLYGGYKEPARDVYHMVEKYFEDQTDYIAMTLWMKEEFCCIVLNYRIKDEDAVWEDVKRCIDLVKEHTNQTFWVYGDAFTEFSKLSESYANVSKYSRWRFYNREAAVCKENELHKEIPTEKFDYEGYSSLLKYQNYGEALEILKNHVYLLCDNMAEEYVLKNITKNLLYNFMVEWEKAEYGQSTKKTEYFQAIDGCIYAEQFRETFSEMIEAFSNEVGKISAAERNITEICQYIRDNYTENLELHQLAEQFNYNYNYLSTYFNQQVSEGFSGYLNRIRIEKACELLNTTTSSISQISGQVGYSDHSYFCRVFKNLKGRTPSQWRRKKLTKN